MMTLLWRILLDLSPQFHERISRGSLRPLPRTRFGSRLSALRVSRVRQLYSCSFPAEAKNHETIGIKRCSRTIHVQETIATTLTGAAPALTMTLLLVLHMSLPLVLATSPWLFVDTIIGALSICSATRDEWPSLVWLHDFNLS